MSLNWDTRGCNEAGLGFLKYTDPKDGKEKWNGLFEALLFNMMFIGPPGNTDKELEEYWTRLNIYQHTLGALANKIGDYDNRPIPVYVTKEQAYALKGIRVNIGPVSKAEFRTRLVDALRTEHQGDYLGK